MTDTPLVDTRAVDTQTRVKARRALVSAIAHGVLVRPSNCDICGKTPGRAKNGKSLIDAHHHNGYDDPLDVQWLCQHCHQLTHARRHGIKHDEEVKQRISQSLKAAYANGQRVRVKQTGEANPFFGKTHTPEARAKISAARRRRST